MQIKHNSNENPGFGIKPGSEKDYRIRKSHYERYGDLKELRNEEYKLINNILNSKNHFSFVPLLKKYNKDFSEEDYKEYAPFNDMNDKVVATKIGRYILDLPIEEKKKFWGLMELFPLSLETLDSSEIENQVKKEEKPQFRIDTEQTGQTGIVFDTEIELETETKKEIDRVIMEEGARKHQEELNYNDEDEKD